MAETKPYSFHEFPLTKILTLFYNLNELKSPFKWVSDTSVPDWVQDPRRDDAEWRHRLYGIDNGLFGESRVEIKKQTEAKYCLTFYIPEKLAPEIMDIVKDLGGKRFSDYKRNSN